MQLSPLLAAQLARDVYDVQNQFQVEDSLDRPEFSSKSNEKQQLKATVGFRLINAKDAFGLCYLVVVLHSKCWQCI